MRSSIYLIALILGFFAIPDRTLSQLLHPLPVSNAYWSVAEFDEVNLVYDDLIYTVKGDTLLNGITYSKVYRLNDYPTFFDTLSTLHCFMRQELASGKIYFIRHYLGETSEKLGYDFAANIGDTLSLPAFDYGNVGDSLYIRERGYCDSIRLLNGEYRRMFFYRSPYSAFAHEITFIEGIGDFYSTFPNRMYEYDAFHYTQSTCVEQNHFLIWSWLSPPDSTRCGFNSLGIDKEKGDPLQQIYPNPAREQVQLRLPQHIGEAEVILISPSGNTVRRYTVSPSCRETVVTVADLPPGIYLISLLSRNSMSSMKLCVLP